MKYSKEHNEKMRGYCNKYEKTHKGFVMRLYRNMKSRVEGVQEKKSHLYKGRSLLPKDEFYSWALNDKDFLQLFENYTVSGYQRRLAPSVDRIDSKKGYSLDNMEFVTMSENSRRGAMAKHTASI